MRGAEPCDGEWPDGTFTDVYLDAYPGLVRLAAFLHPRPSAAEDAVQEAYVRVMARRPDLEEPERLLAYLRRAVVNLCRGAGRHRRVVDRYLAGPARSQAATLRSVHSGDPDVAFARHELVQALKDLPPRQREVVVLRYYAQLSEAETAQTLGVSVGTIKSSAARGLDSLAVKLGASR